MCGFIRRSSSAIDCSVSDFEDQQSPPPHPTENGIKSKSYSSATGNHQHQQQQQRENELHKGDDANSSASSSASPFPCSQGVYGSAEPASAASPPSPEVPPPPPPLRSHAQFNQHQNGHHPQQHPSSQSYYSFSPQFRNGAHPASFFRQSGDDASHGVMASVHRLTDFLAPPPSSATSLTSSSSSSINRHHQSPASLMLHPTDNRLYMTHLD